MMHSVLHSWLDRGLLQPVDGGLGFTGLSPYVPLHPDPEKPGQMIHVPSYVSKPDIQRLPLHGCPTRPWLIRDIEDAERMVAKILKLAEAAEPKDRVLGFDIEWRPTFQAGQPENPPAIVQVRLSLWLVLSGQHVFCLSGTWPPFLTGLPKTHCKLSLG